MPWLHMLGGGVSRFRGVMKGEGHNEVTMQLANSPFQLVLLWHLSLSTHVLCRVTPL